MVVAGSEVTEEFKLSESVAVTVFFTLERDVTEAELDALVDEKLKEAGLDRALLQECTE